MKNQMYGEGFLDELLNYTVATFPTYSSIELYETNIII
jgi:hypothetical protein